MSGLITALSYYQTEKLQMHPVWVPVLSTLTTNPAGLLLETYLEALTRYIVTFHELGEAAVPRRLSHLLVVAPIVDLKHDVLEPKLLRIVVAVHSRQTRHSRRRGVASPWTRMAAGQGAKGLLARRFRWSDVLRAERGGVVGQGVVLQGVGYVVAQDRADVVHNALAGHGLRLVAGLRGVDVRKVAGIETLRWKIFNKITSMLLPCIVYA